jgi:mutator protein MutT
MLGFYVKLPPVNNREFSPRFCPSCGHSLVTRRLKENEPERQVCPACQFVYYLDPKVSACAIIELNGQVVLLKRSINPGYGLWVIPGGFVDRGETIPQAARREVKEETGLDVQVGPLLDLYSYPGKPVVVAVYLVEIKTGRPAALDESMEVGCFTCQEIPWDDLAFPSTRDALTEYCRRKRDAQTQKD